MYDYVMVWVLGNDCMLARASNEGWVFMKALFDGCALVWVLNEGCALMKLFNE